MTNLLPKFDYYEPRDVAGACRLLSQFKGSARIIAGGTDILVNMKKGLIAPERLVGIGKIPGISEVQAVNGGISIGAHLIVEKLVEFDLVKKRFGVLSRAASVLGSPLVRNRATIGGNIVNARPAADLPPPLMAMGARVILTSMRREREVPLDKFFKGPGETVIRPSEVLTRVVVDSPPPFTGADYIKLMHRRSLEIAIVAVASRITVDGPEGVITDAKIILSSVAPKTIHALRAERSLLGERPTENLFARAAKIASTECTPIDDIRGGAEYRRSMVEVLTRRTLRGALDEAVGRSGERGER